MARVIKRPSDLTREPLPLPKYKLEHDFYRHALLRWGDIIGKALAAKWRVSRPKMGWDDFLATLPRDDARYAAECIEIELRSDQEEEEKAARKSERLAEEEAARRDIMTACDPSTESSDY